MKNLIIHIQPVIKPNPGNAGIGIVIYQDRTKIKEHGEYIGVMTNFQAYYIAVVKALELAEIFSPDKIVIHINNNTVVNQLKMTNKVNNSGLYRLYYKVRNSPLYAKCSFELADNKHLLATSLAEQALDERLNDLVDKDNHIVS